MALGGFNELDFLLHIPILNNDDNRDSIFNWVRGEVNIDDRGNLDTSKRNESISVVYKRKDAKDTKSVKNYYKETVYKYSSGDKLSDANPYLRLIKDFEKSEFNSMRFKAADFAYLTDFGVYPINRMWCLRRFTDYAAVPNNLQDWTTTAQYPLSTMVGWIKPEQDNFFNISFNETWMVMTERLDQIVFKILEEEFGFKAASVISLPGWSQGLLFGFLKNMGLTTFDSTNIPQGNPAVLAEAATRASDSKPEYGNKSEMTLSLTTSYEQKYIGDIDPGNAMLDVIHNCIYMGTRNTEYVMSGESDIIKSLRNANATNDLNNWYDFVKSIIEGFMKGLTESIDNIASSFVSNTNSEKTDGKESTPQENKSPKPSAAFQPITGLVSEGSIIAKSILASTVRKWRFALVGSIALMTGENSTPWHLTLGNPYSPFVSLGNIKVNSVNLKFNNEFAFNDVPTRLDVEVSVSLGRNLGANEIFQMFNNGYQRTYADPKTSSSSGPTGDALAGKFDTGMDKSVNTMDNTKLPNKPPTV